MSTTRGEPHPEYQALQHDERFQSWLRMQEAAMDIEFTNYDVPELNGHPYTRQGLVIAEHQLLQRYTNLRDLLSADNLKIGMRFVYFIGETFRQAIEGTEVALPRTRTGPYSGRSSTPPCGPPSTTPNT
ncbi:hypothetical protein [Nocardia rhamnosiphila]